MDVSVYLEPDLTSIGEMLCREDTLDFEIKKSISMRFSASFRSEFA